MDELVGRYRSVIAGEPFQPASTTGTKTGTTTGIKTGTKTGTTITLESVA